MSDLTNRLSKAVFDYLETANLRSEPFSLPRIEEVIAGVMATDSKVPVNVVRHPEYLAQQKALEQYWATIRGRTEPTAPVTYDLAKDPDAFKKAKVGDAVIVNLSKTWEAALMSNYVCLYEMWRRADVETLGDGFTSMNRIA